MRIRIKNNSLSSRTWTWPLMYVTLRRSRNTQQCWQTVLIRANRGARRCQHNNNKTVSAVWKNTVRYVQQCTASVNKWIKIRWQWRLWRQSWTQLIIALLLRQQCRDCLLVQYCINEPTPSRPTASLTRSRTGEFSVSGFRLMSVTNSAHQNLSV